MKKNFICMYLFLLATLASCQSCSSDYKDVDDKGKCLNMLVNQQKNAYSSLKTPKK